MSACRSRTFTALSVLAALSGMGCSDDETTYPLPPTPTQLSVRNSVACARFSDGSVRCWGTGGGFGLGDPDAQDLWESPVTVRYLGPAQSAEVGAFHECALLESADLACWGANYYDNILNGPPVGSDVAIVAEGIHDVRAVATSGSTYALLGDGSVLGWGSNTTGQLGPDGEVGANEASPIRVLDEAIGIVAAGEFACAVTTDHQVLCWGGNGYGQLGGGAAGGWSSTPTIVAGIQGAAGVAVSYEHACAWTDAGDLYCWGGNRWGQISDEPQETILVPQRVTELSDVVSASLDDTRTCVLRAEGPVWCRGLLSNKKSTNPSSPTKVPGLAATAIGSGYDFDCAIAGDPPQVVCWGSNSGGGLGRDEPSFTDTPLPVQFPDLQPGGE